MLATWLVLIWSRTFIGIANGCDTSVFNILGTSVLVLFCTFLCGCNLFLWDDELCFFYTEGESKTFVQASQGEDSEEEETDFQDDLVWMLRGKTVMYSSGLRNSLCIVLALAVFCLFSFVMADRGGWLDLFNDSTYMQIGWWCINKKYIYEVLILIVFPAWSTFILRRVKESAFATSAVCSGVIQILALTMIGFLLYMRKPNMWLVEMAVVNVITLILAVRGYVWKDIKRKGNAVALLILYALLWIAFISLFYHGEQSVAEFMGFSDTTLMNSYFSNVNKILENAPFVGQSTVLLNDPYVLAFVKGSHYLLLSILFYGGWIPAILLIFVETIFIVATAGVVVQNKRHNGRDVLLDIIWLGLFIRVAAGIPYSFGVPIPILLPFTGSVGIIADSICMGMLIMGFIDSKSSEWLGLFEEDFLDDWEEEEYEEGDD